MTGTYDSIASINIAAAKGHMRANNARTLALFMLAVVNVLVVIAAYNAAPGDLVRTLATPTLTVELIAVVVLGVGYVRRHRH